MNKLITLNLFICLFVCLGYVHSQPPQIFPKAKIESFKELMKCTHEKCEEENNALRALFKDELDKCSKACNVVDNMKGFGDETERKRIKECFRANNCKLPFQHIRENRDTPQFKAVKECSEAKCSEQYLKVKPEIMN